MLRVRVSTASAEIIETELITTGRRGLECAFEFNSAWDGLAKTVIVNGVVKRDIVLVSDTIVVPGECLAREQFPLRIGVYGANGAGEIVIPTIWANFGKILPSARPSGVSPDAVTPDVVAQIQTNSSDALRMAQEVLRRADSGEFDGRDGATGPRGEDGTDGQNGNSIWTTTETPAPASGGVAFTQLTGRSNVPPIVGDIIIRSSRYVYDVVEVTPGGVVIGHLIGDIKGATGARGPKGDTGLTGPQGPGVTEDLRAALLQLAQKVAYVDEHGADYYQDLYNALYLPSDIVFITAVFNQGTTKVMDTDSLDSLKPMLTVFGRYDDNTSVVLTNYTLTGVLTPGTSTVTVSALGKTTTFDVFVTGMTSISAVYTQSGTVYDADTLDSLKDDLVVTAIYSDSSTATVPAADYTLSGTLTEGTSTITASYQGKTTTFSVTVTVVLWLFKDGDECTGVTGGWDVGVGFVMNENRFNAEKSNGELSISLNTVSSNASAQSISTHNLIDFSGYTKLVVECSRLVVDQTGTFNAWAYIPATLGTAKTQSGAYGGDYTNRRIYLSENSTGEAAVSNLVFEEGMSSGYISINANPYNNAKAGSYIKVTRIYLINEAEQ